VLRRFTAYLDKMFGFGSLVGTLQDCRVSPSIPTSAVWLSLFGMFSLRLRSLNRLEQELRRPHRWEGWLGKRRPSADTIGYALCRFSLDALRRLLRRLNKTAWRNKAIQPRAGQRLRVVAVDGHELWCSRSRCCPHCLTRKVKVQDVEVLEYYHRIVVAQWVGTTPPAIVDLELVLPEEGEVTAARRLMDRLLREYARLIDVVSTDALYLEAPFLKPIVEAGKYFIVVMKQERRDLYGDAQQLRALVAPQSIENPDGALRLRLWDLPDMTTFSTLGQPVRVVWCEEHAVRNRIRGGRKVKVEESHEWIWVTNLPQLQFPASQVRTWGHDRWDVENRVLSVSVHEPPWGLW